DVCPWNRFSRPGSELAFEPIPEILNLSKSAWEQLSEEDFRRIFRKSPIKRSKWAGVLRNLKAI
ncbi:MAG: tRNA epoxyqueuosine(34) reductase QueG, partial [Chitinophagaceae bacterium]